MARPRTGNRDSSNNFNPRDDNKNKSTGWIRGGSKYQRERDIVSYAYLCTYPVAAVDGDVLLWLSSGANNAGSITIFRV